MPPTLQGALKNGFGEAPVACDMPEPCKLPSLDSCQKRFLWTHKGVDLALHLVVGLVLQVGDTEKFPQALGFEGLVKMMKANSSTGVRAWLQVRPSIVTVSQAFDLATMW